MSVTVRPHQRGGWIVDVITRLADGRRYRERRRLSVRSASAAQRWGEDRERHLLQHGPPQVTKEVPILNEFASRFLNVHLLPLLGTKKLDAITNAPVQRLKHALQHRSAKTTNNVLTVLNVLLKKAVEWGVIDRMPCIIRLLAIPKTAASFYGFDEYERVVEVAKSDDSNAFLIALLGGEAGLRCGEMIALEWGDVDLGKQQLRVQRSQWKGHVTATKGGRVRFIPLTVRLAAALREHRHLRTARVLYQRDRSPLTQKIVQDYMKRAARRANVKPGVHILRHTFCSHLAMRGAPARAIQELAGHQDLATTQRYMHVSPAAIDQAIRLLDEAGTSPAVATWWQRTLPKIRTPLSRAG